MLNSGHVLEPCGQTYCSSPDHPGGQYLELNIAEACPETELMSSCSWYYINLNSRLYPPFLFFSFFSAVWCYSHQTTDVVASCTLTRGKSHQCAKELKNHEYRGRQEDPLALWSDGRRSPLMVRVTTRVHKFECLSPAQTTRIKPQNFIPFACSCRCMKVTLLISPLWQLPIKFWVWYDFWLVP